MNIPEKICDNGKKIKIFAVIALIFLIVCRIYINNDKDSFINYSIKEGDIGYIIFFSMGLLPCFLIPMEMIAVFVKKKVSMLLSITSITICMPIILIQIWLLFMFIFAGLLGEGWEGVSELIIEIIVNVIFCITAGVTIILKEEKYKKE